jgi:hypothetical protein
MFICYLAWLTSNMSCPWFTWDWAWLVGMASSQFELGVIF